MNELIRHIEYLISRKDCVIIPGFGAVLAKNESARFDESTGVFYPPTRSFAFNSDLTHNDGLLICSVARAKGLTYEDAAAYVAHGVDEMRHNLYELGELTLGMVGIIMYDFETKTVSFTAFPASSLSVGYFWLPKIELEPAQPQTVPVPVAVPKRPSAFRRFVRKASGVAASLAFLLGFYFLYCLIATPIVVEDSAHASLAPSVPAPAVTNVQKAPAVKYQVVLAQFNNEDEAVEYINLNSPYRLTISVCDGKYCVSCGTFDTLADAETVVSFLSDRFPGSWVSKK